ncbi:MAG: phosphomannose isomerase type II C-terminal cupin domain [Candidatus Melainabacteria bacterium]|nr:phosphomannose isomerase type II C-terminal cupin domain [Candidatus Melainabacteria bacterium]
MLPFYVDPATMQPLGGEVRPWGSFLVLADCAHFKLKQLTVTPGHRLSLQLHQHRQEHWIVLAGEPEITVGERTWRARVGEYIYIPAQTKHRLANPGAQPVEIVEVQQGSYFGEDDIVRFADDYDRHE